MQGSQGERIVVHGNNKSDEELRAAAEAGVRFVVLDALDEAERAAAAGVRRALVRVTPGIEADTHEKIRTAHHGSKFGLPPEDALGGGSGGARGGPRGRGRPPAHRLAAASTRAPGSRRSTG